MQRRFNEFLRAEKRSGTTVFLSSHVLSEVRRVCDRVGIIRDGRIVTVETVEDLLGRSGKVVRARAAGEVAAPDVDLDGVHDLSVEPVDADYDRAVPAPAADDAETVTEFTFTYTGDVDSLVDFLDGHHLLELDVEEAPLERVFMQFYGDDDAGVEA